MTVIELNSRRAGGPAPSQAGCGEKAPARIAPVTRLDPSDEEKMRKWAEERMRDAISVYRAMFTSQELVMRLARAAEDELKLIEADAR